MPAAAGPSGDSAVLAVALITRRGYFWRGMFYTMRIEILSEVSPPALDGKGIPCSARLLHARAARARPAAGADCGGRRALLVLYLCRTTTRVPNMSSLFALRVICNGFGLTVQSKLSTNHSL